MSTLTQTDPAWLDHMYNNRARVPEHAADLSRWFEQSTQAKKSQNCMLDIAYGQSGGEKLDVFVPPTANAPVLVFIHGGYWRSQDKEGHSFIAPAFTSAGACVVILDYDLCPAVTIPQIIMQMVNALAWVYRNVAHYGGNPECITLAGHSAGGHLTAMLLACAWKDYAADLPSNLVKNALSISGLYDLEPLRQTPFLKDSLNLTTEQVLQASPALLPVPSHGTLYSVVGADESAEFLRQNRLIQQVWGCKTVPVCEALPGLNHFSVLDALIQPGQRLHSLVMQLLGKTEYV